MVFQAALAILTSRDQIQLALDEAGAFGKRIEAIAPKGQTKNPMAQLQASLVYGHIEVINEWGLFFVDPATSRVLVFEGNQDLVDGQPKGTWTSADRALPPDRARELAVRYFQAAGGPLNLDIEDDGQEGNYYGFAGKILVNGLPLLESDVEVVVGPISGSLQRLVYHFGTASGNPPAISDDPRPKLSSADAVVAAAESVEIPGRSGTFVTWGPCLGWICPARRQGWFDNLTTAELNDYALDRARLVYGVTVRAFDRAGTPFTRRVYIDANSGRVLEGRETPGYGIGKDLRPRISVAPARLEVFDRLGHGKKFISRLT